jgi:signal transduction histidine kinase
VNSHLNSVQGQAETKRPQESFNLDRRYSIGMAVAYLAASCVWIKFSNTWIGFFAQGSPERLETLHLVKAFGFMTVTSIGFYFSADWVSRKAAKSARQLQQAQESWMEAERQAAPALLATCISHDVANLLTVIRLNLERLKRYDQLPAPVAETVAKIDHGTDRLMELVKRLRGASSSLFQDEPPRFDFSKVVEETLSLMRNHACCESASIEFKPAPGAILCGYPILVHQLAMNLMINAAEATGRVGRVRLTVGRIEGGVCLSVEDNGPGVAASLRDKVLSAFFTTKTTGSGLGLTSVRSCVDIHEGTMKITDSADLGGACFIITLPDLTRDRLENLRHPSFTPVPARPLFDDQLQN